MACANWLMRLPCFLSPPSGERIEVRGLNFQKQRLPNPTIIYLLTPALSSLGEEREEIIDCPKQFAVGCAYGWLLPTLGVAGGHPPQGAVAILGE